MSHKILIVEDEDSISFALRRFLSMRGFDVDCASELEEAQALVAHVPYAAVVADLRLTCVHGAEGLEMISHVRKHAPGTRTILLTAYGSPEIEAEARSRGVDAVLPKPQPLGELADLLTALVEAE
ncbi:MAG TPA: response regulator [Thermoanaerobaculia bacterium]|nr:response regulator [Thermoanaerobaculia bacterium]